MLFSVVVCIQDVHVYNQTFKSCTSLLESVVTPVTFLTVPRLPCPTVCVSDTERPRTLPHRSADAKPCTDDPVEGASASDPVERSGPSDVNLRANGFCGMAQQNTTYWLDGKGLSPLMGRPIDCSKGVTSTGDESHSGLLPAHNNTAQPTCTPAQDMPK